MEHSQEVFATEVAVSPSSGTHDSGSSKVKLHNIVDYTWEERFYTGQLLAVHIGGVYIAYGIKGNHCTRTGGRLFIIINCYQKPSLVSGQVNLQLIQSLNL